MLGKTAQDKSDIPFCEPGRNIGNAFVKKAVVAEVGMWIERYWSEKHDDRLFECVRSFDRDSKCGIVDCPLRTLHPVNDTCAFGIRYTLTTNCDPRVDGKPYQMIHMCARRQVLGDRLLNN